MSSRPLNQLARQIAKTTPPTQQGIDLRQGVVDAVNVGPPASVDLLISGSPIVVPGVRYLSSYAPVVGDVVFMLAVGSSLLVLGDLA